MRAYLVKKPGDIKSLKLQKIEDPKPTAHQVVVKHTAIGINYFDVLFRNGNFSLDETPAILGMEACGIIESVGSGVKDFKVGQRVAYATGPIGAYAEKRAIAQDFLVIPPSTLSDEQVAGSLLKGLMAHTLLFRVYLAGKVKQILVHGAAGGVGHLLCQWANHLGIKIIGTVGNEEKITAAKSFGCEHVINYSKNDFVAEVEKITDGNGVGIVYDGIGKDTISKSLECLWPLGICVSYGEASGPTSNINLNSLFLNSLYITRPLLALYKSKRVELALSANEVFKMVEKGTLKPNIKTYNFDQLPQAHLDLESRKTIGSLVVTF
ncbi:MAG: NADPH2:quinone reductase [Lentimonas sp.]|jgi:NADPH2:quinone reductase